MSTFARHINGIHYEETGVRIRDDGTKEFRIRNLGVSTIEVVRQGSVRQRLPQFWEGWIVEPFGLRPEKS